MMRANRLRMLAALRRGPTYGQRGMGGMWRWMLKHGLVEQRQFRIHITPKGEEECRKAVADYSARGRLTQVFQHSPPLPRLETKL